MLSPATLLHGVPAGLRAPLIAAYVEIAQNYSEERWEPSELNGGKFCEIVYTILEGAISGKYASAPSKPPKFVEACRALEQKPADPTRIGDRSLRILIPRLLPYLYEIRNNRGVGHVGGEVNPNFSDATSVLSCSNWVMAELVRIYHNVSLADAQSAVDTLVERKLAIVWEFEGVKRVLDPNMPIADQILVLLYSTNGWVDEAELKKWADYQNTSLFRSRYLKPLHKSRVLEYDSAKRRVRLTPLGSKEVEDRILKK